MYISKQNPRVKARITKSASPTEFPQDLRAQLFVGTPLQALLQRELALLESSGEAISNHDRNQPTLRAV